MASRVFVGVAVLAVALSATISAQTTPTFGQGAVRPGNGITAPKLIRQVEPKYTTEAMSAKISGDVELEAVVNADGTVGDIRVTKALDDKYGLDQNAIRAAKMWLFEPGRDRDGRPVPVIVTLILSFRTASQRSLGNTQLPDDAFTKGTCAATDTGNTPPKLVSQVEPKYTSDAIRAKIDGTVTVEAVVNTDGSVARARVIRSLDKLYGLDGNALAAVSQWTFEPDSGKCAGLPAPTLVTLILNFRIH